MKPSKLADFAIRTLADPKERPERQKCGFWSLDEKEDKSHSPRPNTQEKKTMYL